MEYVGDRGKRPKVSYMLAKFKEDLHFAFSPVTDPLVDLDVLETQLNDAIVPIANQNDFSADVRKQVKALR